MVIHDIGRQDFYQTWQKMRDYTLARDTHSANQIWLVEHPPVFTLGRAGKTTNLLTINSVTKSVNQPRIPFVKTDRGGDITYHGPGQFIAYLLCDIRREGVGIRQFVRLIEQSVIDYLTTLDIEAQRQAGRPGIYTKLGKIAALGLNCKQYGTYHGVSINVNMDLSPFQQINPCGIKQPIAQIKQWHPYVCTKHSKRHWCKYFLHLWEKAPNSI